MLHTVCLCDILLLKIYESYDMIHTIVFISYDLYHRIHMHSYSLDHIMIHKDQVRRMHPRSKVTDGFECMLIQGAYFCHCCFEINHMGYIF